MLLKGSQYVGKEHEHVIAGDLCICFDNKWRENFCDGSKFRESKCSDFEKVETSIVEGIDNCINTWCTKKGISKISWLQW